MSPPPHFTSSIWFATLVALLVALGSQVLIETLTPIAIFDWLLNESRRQGPVVLVAGESFWREDSIIRAMAFGFGAFVGCLLARTHTWHLLISLVVVSMVATAFAQFPGPSSTWQLVVWASAAPAGTLLVTVLFNAWKADT